MAPGVQGCPQKHALMKAYLEALHEFHRLRSAQVRGLLLSEEAVQNTPELAEAWERRELAKNALLDHLLLHKSGDCV
jgi:hypothetical protein